MAETFITRQGQVATTSVVAATITDLSINAQTYGKVIPLGFGLRRVLGQVIVSSPIDPTSRLVTFAVSLGYSGFPNRSRFVRRVWIGDNMQLVYDASTGVTPSFTLRFYSGAEGQGADPDILALHADTPAYREHSYLVLKDLNARDYGNKLPVVIAEIVENAESLPFATVYQYAYPPAVDAIDAGVAYWVPDFANRYIYAYYGFEGEEFVLTYDMSDQTNPNFAEITGKPEGATSIAFCHYLPALAKILAVVEVDGEDPHLVLLDPSSGVITLDGGPDAQAMLAFNNAATGTRASANIALDALNEPVQFVLGMQAGSDVGCVLFKITDSAITNLGSSDPGGRTQKQVFGTNEWTGFETDYEVLDAWVAKGNSGALSCDFYISTRAKAVAEDEPSTGYIYRVPVPHDTTATDDVVPVLVQSWSDDPDGVTGALGPVFAAFDSRTNTLIYAETDGTDLIATWYDAATDLPTNALALTGLPPLVLNEYGIDTQYNSAVLVLQTTTPANLALLNFDTGGFKTITVGDGIVEEPQSRLIVDGTYNDIVVPKITAGYGPVAVGASIDPGVKVPLSDIILGTAYQMGYTEAEIETENVTELVTGALYSTDVSFRSFIDDLAGAFGLRKKQSDKLTIRRIDAPFTADATIGTTAILDKSGTSFAVARSEESGIANQVEIQFVDADHDYMASAMIARRPAYPIETSRSFEARSYSLPIVLSGVEAAGLAAKALYREWSARTTYKFRTLPRWLALEPLDVVTFTSGGRTYTGIVTEASIGADFSIDLTIEAVWDDRSVVVNRDDPTVLAPVTDQSYAPTA